MTADGAWPAANEYMQALQNPRACFADPILRQGVAAQDRLGMPLVMSGNFAYVFKLQLSTGARAIKCFRRFLGDRQTRYQAIDRYLDVHRIPALAAFEYEHEGMTVSGKRYPALIMEWVDGNPLDVYIGSLVAQQKAKDNLRPLADQWARLVAHLHSSAVAHGDLQHGNVIVTASGLLKLVDLDGMYVPELHGRQTDELGHVHFQHPKRGQSAFDRQLDNFSSLAIYLSILALDQDPGLWDEFHDDNLIFSKDDFADPLRSRLFARLRSGRGEIARLAGALEQACLADSPAATPHLSALVHIRSPRLPEWMRPSTVITVQTKTREVFTPALSAPSHSPAPAARPARGTTLSRWWKGATLWREVTPPAAPAPATGERASPWRQPGSGLRAGLFGLLRATPTARASGPAASPPAAESPAAPPFGRGVIGSSIRMTYHRPGYDCAARISGRNRVYLASSKQAISRGYRPCRLCNP